MPHVTPPLFSIVLPFYKQDDHAHAVIEDFRKSLDKLGDTYELIVVVNGAKDIAKEHEFRILSESPHIVIHKIRAAGWGRAVHFGITQSVGTYVCYTNSARTSGAELVRILRYAKVETDSIVKATRIERTTSIRKWTSIFYNLENRLLLKTPIWDVNATPKVIPKHLLDQIPLSEMGDTIDAELMYKAFRKHIPIIEIPIRQHERKSGKSTTNWKSAAKMFFGILHLKRHVR